MPKLISDLKVTGNKKLNNDFFIVELSGEQKLPEMNPGKTPAAVPAAAPAVIKAQPKPKQLQLSALHNSIKTAMHLSITFAAMGCFLLAGSAGTPKPDMILSLLSPLAAS